MCRDSKKNLLEQLEILNGVVEEERSTPDLLQDDFLPLARMTKDSIPNEYFNASPVSNAISSMPGIVGSSQPLELTSYKNSVIVVDLVADKDVSLSNQNVTAYDLSIMDAIYTLQKSGINTFTPEQIYRVMIGDLSINARPQRIGTITKSIRKLRRILISIDYTDELAARGIKLRRQRIVDSNQEAQEADSDGYFKLSSYLLPVREVNLKLANSPDAITGYQLIEVPALYTYAERTNRIAVVPRELLLTDLKNTDSLILIRHYLIRRIEELRRIRNKKNARCIYYLEHDNTPGMIRELWPEDNIANIRDKKKSTHTSATAILDGFARSGYIESYTVLQDGKSIIGLSLYL